MAEEDRIVLVSVGVDIGSSTSHLLFSRLELERQDNRYVTVKREVLYQSDILLRRTSARRRSTSGHWAISSSASIAAAGLSRDQVDTGALILTGVALLRDNARAIADLFAEEAGRFVAVSAGDNLEASMAAHGSGAVELSRSRRGVMNVDVGGGTTKVVICRDGATPRADGHRRRAPGWSPSTRKAASPAWSLPRARSPGAWDCLWRSAAGQAVEDLRRMAAYMVDELVGEISVGGSPTAALAPAAHRATARPRPDRGDHVLGRRVRVRLRAGRRRPLATWAPLIAEELRQRPAGRAHPGDRGRHPRHGHRRLAVHHPGLGQHDLSVAAGRRAGAQHSGGDAALRLGCCRVRAAAQVTRRDPRRLAALRPARRQRAGGDRRALGGLGDIPSHPGLLPGSGRRDAAAHRRRAPAHPGLRQRHRRPAGPALSRGADRGAYRSSRSTAWSCVSLTTSTSGR